MDRQSFDITLPGDQTVDHILTALDINYVNSGNAIGIVYVFENPIPLSRLKSSLVQLLAEFPALAGRMDMKAMRVFRESAGVPFEHVGGYPGSATDYAAPDRVISNRLDFVTEPARKAVLCGDAALMTVKLTEFEGGGCALGVSINHGLMDAAGFHLTLQRWSDIFMGKVATPLIWGGDIYRLGTGRSRQEWQADMQAAGMAPPLNFNRLTGRVLKSAMFGLLDKSRARPPEMIYFTPDRVRALKEAVQAESGLDWISTNMAISAHILNAIMPLQISNQSRTLGIGNVINIRGRLPSRSDIDPSRYVGNALYIMVSRLAGRDPIVSLSRGEIAKFLRHAFDQATPEFIERNMGNIVDALKDGFGYAGLNVFKPIMAINNQSKFNVYDIDFGAGRPLRVMPQDVGDHIMIFPASDGGMEIYLRDFAGLKRQRKLQDPKWMWRLMAT